MALILILAAVACGPTEPVADTTPSPSATPAPETDTPPAPSTTPTSSAPEPPPATAPASETAAPETALPDLSPEAEQVLVLAREDLAQRLGLAEEGIVVQSIEPVTWPDTSLGCPQPGMFYAQILTPGYLVILEAGGEAYEYHTGTPEPVVLCEKESTPMEDSLMPGTVEPAGAVEPGLEALIQQVKEDLALRLSVVAEQITVLEAKAVVWPDASLGCPQPGMRYLQVPQDGALILLGFEDTVYEYHSGGGRDPFLCEQPLKLEKDAPTMLDLFQLTPGSPDD
jgi:hypothetical protein